MIDIEWLLIAIPMVLGVYAYALYPCSLWIYSRIRGPGSQAPAREFPFISIVVPAYNEEATIGGAIDALLAQDYPAHRRQILILSDASSDRTDEIVRGYSAQGIELLRMPTRSGKTAAENASCALLKGEIVVNTDASIRLLPGAVSHLIQAMGDPKVGVASGRDVSVAPGVESANAAEAGYVGYEMWIRRLETQSGGIVGASGSGYAIRKSLHMIPIPDDLSRDFSAALTARRHGYRAVSVDKALCLVPRTSSLRQEYRRKVRTISRGMATLTYQRGLLNPIVYGAFSWKLFSHKILRWLLPLSALPAFVGLVMLADDYTWALAALALTLFVGALATLGLFWPSKRPLPRILSIAAFGTAANVAVVHAWWRSRRRHHDHIWEPTRR